MTETLQEHVLDVRGQHCPMPVVKSAKAIKELATGEVLTVLATDRGSVTDIPAWAGSVGHAVVDWHDEGDHLVFHVRKGG